jgi:hypothetical protein
VVVAATSSIFVRVLDSSTPLARKVLLKAAFSSGVGRAHAHGRNAWDQSDISQ